MFYTFNEEWNISKTLSFMQSFFINDLAFFTTEQTNGNFFPIIEFIWKNNMIVGKKGRVNLNEKLFILKTYLT